MEGKPISPTRRRRDFGANWWSDAWIDALEMRAQLDPNRLPRGRTYARQSRVDDLTIGRGIITARVWGSRDSPYRVRVRIRTFSETEWDRALAAIASRAAHVAGLLDGELSPEIVDDVRGAGIDLLPGPGELGFECSCPDWAVPCKHSAAVAYLTAKALDVDPFDLLLLRGRDRETLLSGLRRVRASAAAATQATNASYRPGGSTAGGVHDPGVVARDAPAPLPLPAVRPAPTRPGRALPLPSDPPAPGLTAAALDELAADAAARAWAVLTGAGTSGLQLDPEADLARRALDATRAGTVIDLARRVGRGAPELVALATAWQYGDAAGVDALTHVWDPTPEELEPGYEALTAVRSGGSADPDVVGRKRLVRVRHHTMTVGDIQLRLGRDRLWYLFERRGRNGRIWDLAAPPADDPAELVDV